MATGATQREVNTRRLRLREGGLEWREVDGEIVVLDSARGVFLSINPSAVPLWEKLAAGTTESELAETLRATFPTAETVEDDVRAFVEEMRQQGLLAE